MNRSELIYNSNHVIRSTNPKGTMETIQVAAGLIWNRKGEILFSRRPAGTHLEGYWELPGGKIEPDETAEETVKREILEELGIKVRVANEFARTTHEYPGKTVTIIAFHTLHITGEPKSIGVAEFRWIKPGEIETLTFPEADKKLFIGDWRTPPDEFGVED